MSCLVKLFEPNSARPPVHVTLPASNIDFVAVDQTTLVNCSNVEPNKPLNNSATSHGANLQFTQASIVYQVAIVDNQQVYGGTTILSLTGTTLGDLDVVLDKLPPTQINGGGGLPAGANATQVRTAVAQDRFWNPGQKRAVLGVIDALVSLRGVTTYPVLNFVHRYAVTLRDCGIDSSIF